MWLINRKGRILILAYQKLVTLTDSGIPLSILEKKPGDVLVKTVKLTLMVNSSSESSNFWLHLAAINYLLLKDLISCDLIPGSCCFNISNNVPYIKYLVQQLKGELQHMFLTNVFSFGGSQWTHWLLMLLGPLLLLLPFCLWLPCIFQGLSVPFGTVWSEILKLHSQLHPWAKKDGIEFQWRVRLGLLVLT